MKHFFKLVLLIDDNEIDNALNEILIRKSNLAETIIVKQCAEEAIAYLKEDAIATNQIPDLIFLDIRMPLGDGFKFLEDYKELPSEFLNKTKIVMLTSSLDDKDLEKASSNKFIHIVLSKPLTIETVEDLKKRF